MVVHFSLVILPNPEMCDTPIHAHNCCPTALRPIWAAFFILHLLVRHLREGDCDLRLHPSVDCVHGTGVAEGTIFGLHSQHFVFRLVSSTHRAIIQETAVLLTIITGYVQAPSFVIMRSHVHIFLNLLLLASGIITFYPHGTASVKDVFI